MSTHPKAEENNTESADERTKVAARCCECDNVYSAWVLSDNTVQPIGLPGGCACGASDFEVISE